MVVPDVAAQRRTGAGGRHRVDQGVGVVRHQRRAWLQHDEAVAQPDRIGQRHARPDAAQARLVLSVMDRLGIRRAVLVGHSMGGNVVTQAAMLAPDRVAGLVLVDAAIVPASAGQPLGSRIIAAALEVLNFSSASFEPSVWNFFFHSSYGMP